LLLSGPGLRAGIWPPLPSLKLNSLSLKTLSLISSKETSDFFLSLPAWQPCGAAAHPSPLPGCSWGGTVTSVSSPLSRDGKVTKNPLPVWTITGGIVSSLSSCCFSNGLLVRPALLECAASWTAARLSSSPGVADPFTAAADVCKGRRASNLAVCRCSRAWLLRLLLLAHSGGAAAPLLTSASCPSDTPGTVAF
jgi:hypothetical protein